MITLASTGGGQEGERRGNEK
jgi:hypothetical protein